MLSLLCYLFFSPIQEEVLQQAVNSPSCADVTSWRRAIQDYYLMVELNTMLHKICLTGKSD